MKSTDIKIKALILDMDGVLWRGKESIGELPKIFANIHAKELALAFATNNSSTTAEQYVKKLDDFGVSATTHQVITSGLATAEYLGGKFSDGITIYVIGEEGLLSALKGGGFKVGKMDAEIVVVGLDRRVNYEKLKTAAFLIQHGALFIGTNPDTTLPTPDGLAPGAGSIIAAIEAATGITATIIGKPKPLMFQQALRRLGTSPNETLVVGDRLETDIAGGQAAGCKTALVLSGVTTKEMADLWSPAPDIIATDLGELVDQL